jgi:predicted flavoprotein YhiN
VALYLRTLGLVGAFALSACGAQETQGQNQARPVVDVTPDASAVADVDRRATLALKQSLMNKFSADAPTGIVEVILDEDGFDCGPNPTAPSERACLKAVREGLCEINTIVRTAPYDADKAQVIKVCELAAPKQ